MIQKLFKNLCPFMVALALSACGGGGPKLDSTSGSTASSGTSSVADISVLLSSSTLVNSGTGSVTATITAVDANRNAVSGATISVAVDSGVVTTANGRVTNTSGVVAATVTTGSDLSKRTITLTVSANGIERKTAITVVDATGGTVASDITLALSAPTVLDTGSATVLATVTAVDSNRNAIAGIPITLSVDSDATVSVSSATTNSSGVVTGTIGIGANKSNRTITVTAKSGNLAPRIATLQVTGAKLTGTAVPAALAVGATGKVQYKVTDANNTALAGQTISIIGVAGAQVAATTDINGAYEYSYVAPSASTTLNIVASSAGVQATTTVVVQSGSSGIPAVPAGTVRSASVRATPSVVAVNSASSTTNRTEVRALFVGDNNQPIKNVRVRFDLNGDANSIGGTFSTGSALLYSDANGVALSSYIPGTRSSPTDGVVVRACWDYTDFDAGTCPNQSPIPTTTNLTVISDALSVTIGTDGLVVVGDLVYTQRYVVQVNDASGLAKSDVTVSPVVDLPRYLRGVYQTPKDWTQIELATCENEDINRNGVLEVYSNGGVEDANGNQQADPRKADVVVAFENGSKTDATGRVVLRLTYPQNVGSWLDYVLTVAASGISGTEGRASYRGRLVVPVEVLKAEADPPFKFSPYGTTAPSGTVRVTALNGDSAVLCKQ